MSVPRLTASDARLPRAGVPLPGVFVPSHQCFSSPWEHMRSTAVWPIEKDPRNIDAIARHLGWYGHTRDANHHPGAPIDLARERAKQAANRAVERLRQDGFVPDVVDQSLSPNTGPMPTALKGTETSQDSFLSGMKSVHCYGKNAKAWPCNRGNCTTVPRHSPFAKSKATTSSWATQ
jgi:hypothetical protein